MFLLFFMLFLGSNTKTLILAKVGLAKVGHPLFGQSRSIKVGQSRSNFWAKVGLANKVFFFLKVRLEVKKSVAVA